MTALNAASQPPLNMGAFWQFAAAVVRWVDGDTVVVDCLVDVGFEELVTRRRTIRLMGVDTPERNSSDPAQRAAAHAATAASLGFAPFGSVVTVQVYGFDKYGGRDDGVILLPDGRNVSTLLVDGGFGKVYNGGKR